MGRPPSPVRSIFKYAAPTLFVSPRPSPSTESVTTSSNGQLHAHVTVTSSATPVAVDHAKAAVGHGAEDAAPCSTCEVVDAPTSHREPS